MKKKYQRQKLGNVYAIPLPNGQFAFGRQFQEGAIAVYKHIGINIDDLPDNEDYQFIVGVYQKVLTCCKWPKVDYRPFEKEEDSWSPPEYIWDPFTGKYEMYYKGKRTPCTKAECKGLEPAAVWDDQHIIDRIMGIDKWQKANREWAYIKRHGQEAFDELTKNS